MIFFFSIIDCFEHKDTNALLLFLCVCLFIIVIVIRRKGVNCFTWAHIKAIENPTALQSRFVKSFQMAKENQDYLLPTSKLFQFF